GESAEDVLRAYRETAARANEAVAACPDLAGAGPRPGGRPGPAPPLRWTLTHLVEETGRHAGHADILRELIDGATGRGSARAGAGGADRDREAAGYGTPDARPGPPGTGA